MIVLEDGTSRPKGGLMMKAAAILLVAVLVMALAPGACPAAEVADAVMCLGVQDREPVHAGDSFSSDVGKVWCWSKIKDGKGEVIKHAYYHNDKEMAVVELSIGSPLWRTHSSKRILPGWTGPWRVDIIGEDGTLLKSLAFTIAE